MFWSFSETVKAQFKGQRLEKNPRVRELTVHLTCRDLCLLTSKLKNPVTGKIFPCAAL